MNFNKQNNSSSFGFGLFSVAKVALSALTATVSSQDLTLFDFDTKLFWKRPEQGKFNHFIRCLKIKIGYNFGVCLS